MVQFFFKYKSFTVEIKSSVYPCISRVTHFLPPRDYSVNKGFFFAPSLLFLAEMVAYLSAPLKTNLSIIHNSQEVKGT